MSARLMEPGIASALRAGRVLVVPSAQRAAALRWNWARVQLADGHAVWSTPQIITWDAWLESQWDSARLAGRLDAGTRRLNRSQQLQLWQRVLAGLQWRSDAGFYLVQHAAALMSAAAGAAQWLLPLSRLAVTEEERLLATALAEAREWCRRHDCVALPLCTPAQLAAFITGQAPLIAGQSRLTALQQAVAEQCWPGEQVLHECASQRDAPVRLVVADSLEGEIRACARWCGEHLAADPQRRLLVITATEAPSVAAQATLLARELCAGTAEVPEEVLENGLVAVEGGRPLSHQQLIADALCALRLLREPLSFDDLARVLRSAYFKWGSPSQMLALLAVVAETGFAQWSLPELHTLLSGTVDRNPVARLFVDWLGEWRAWPRQAARAQWALHFSRWLGAARFARNSNLGSSDAQRLQRWNELLDEFAALDAVGEPPVLADAVEELLRLAAQSRHAARSSDAAITLTSDRGAPVAHYDGIWVLGLVEQRWPEPPRPDPYVPLSEQRRCGWDEAGARQRLEQARWSLGQWRASAAELVLSHPRLEGDVHHRPSGMPGLAPPHRWEPAATAQENIEAFCMTPSVPATGLAPLPCGPQLPLRQAQNRLVLQQSCAFRSQAELRLGATQAPVISDAIHPLVRGVMLHAVLEGVWRELGDQRGLKGMDESGRRELFERHWSRQLAQRAAQGRPSYPQRVLERERQRSRKVILRILAIEEARPFFRVLSRERQLQLATEAGVMSLRVDRIDEDEQGRRWLIDYKSGVAGNFRLAAGEAQPLQLALYEQALDALGEPVHGMALLSLSPAKAGFSGAAPESGWSSRWQAIPDWEQQKQRWRAQLLALLRDHVNGEASVAPLRDACRTCHLQALCRRADAPPDADEEAVVSDESP